MRKIQECVKNILSKRYGKDVRQSFCDAILEIDSVASTSRDSAAANAATAAQKASEAKVSEAAAKTSEENAAQSASEAMTAAANAAAIAGAGIATQDTAGFMRGGENYVDESGALTLTTRTTKRILEHSHAGGIRIHGMYGASVQGSTTGKNLLKPKGTYITNGITFTQNADGSITANGTATANAIYSFDALADLVDETVILSGCPSGGSASTYKMSIQNVSGQYAYDDTGSGVTVTVTNETFTPRIVVYAGTTVPNVVFWPMLSYGGGEYEPYTGGAPSPSIDYPQEIENVVVSEVKTVGKNLLKNTLTDGNYHSMKCVVNPDKSVTLNGTPTITAFLTLNSKVLLKKGDYILSAGVHFSNDVRMYIYDANDSTFSVICNTGERAKNTFTLAKDTVVSVHYRVGENTTLNNFRFYPMIYRADIAEDTYEPYIESAISLSEPVMLNGFGGIADELVSGTKRFVKAVFDGSDDENWKDLTDDYTSKTEGQHRYTLSEPMNYKKANVRNYISNYGAKRPLNGVSLYTADGISLYSNVERTNRSLFVTSKDITSLDELRQRLAEVPLVVVAELDTPIIEPLPTADQTALHSLKSFDNITYITTDSEIEPEIDLEYGTSKVGAQALEALQRTSDAALARLLTLAGGTMDDGAVLLFKDETGTTCGLKLSGNGCETFIHPREVGTHDLYTNTINANDEDSVKMDGTLESFDIINYNNADKTSEYDYEWSRLKDGQVVVGENIEGIDVEFLRMTKNHMKVYPGSTGVSGYYVHLTSPGIKYYLGDGALYCDMPADLGTATQTWGQIYSTNSVISTSDRNAKKDIAELDGELSQKLVMALKPSSYKFIDNTSDRTHYGLISQDVEDTMTELGMNSRDFAGFIKSPRMVEKEYTDEKGNTFTVPEVVEGEYNYALRYEEFIAPLIKVVQIQQQSIQKLQKAIEELKAPTTE